MVRKKLQSKYMVMETRKDGTKFTNRPLKEAAERLQNLSGQYDDMQKQLVEQVTAHMIHKVHIKAKKVSNGSCIFNHASSVASCNSLKQPIIMQMNV